MERSRSCLRGRRDLDTVRVKEVLDIVRTAEEKTLFHSDRIQSEAVVDGIMERVDSAVNAALGEMSVKDLVMSESGSVVSMEGLGEEDVTTGR